MRMTMTTLPPQWPTLLLKLDRLRDILRTQGCISSRIASGRRVWSVRYFEPSEDEGTVQRSLYLGSDPSILNLAREYLDDLRVMNILVENSSS